MRQGRTLNARCVVHVADVPFLLTIASGTLAGCMRDFTIRGTAAAWEALWEPIHAARRLA